MPVVRARLYRLSEYLIAVFAFPNTSYTAANRGAGFLQFGRFSIPANVRSGTNRPAGDVAGSTWALSASQRMPALTVSRFSVHESCA